jgi:hypothetical protein
MRRLFLVVLLVGAAGWATLRQYGQQNQLHQQLEQLMVVLTTENDVARRTTDAAIKKMEEAAAKDRNKPADMALLHRAEALQACVKQLVEALRTDGDQLRRATNNKEAQPLQHLGAPIGAGLSHDAPRRQTLERRLTAYTDTLRRLGLLEAKAAPLLMPAFEANTPIVEALANLTQLESELLARHTYALQQISKNVGVRRWPTHPLAFATAESNVVAPGGTYRAQLGVTSYFSANELRMQMTYDVQPVPLTPAGTGVVRFRAPTRSGPATWTGTIRTRSNGRDSTFKIIVPYRVVRR